MGYMVHHGIVVTFWDEKILKETREKAKVIFRGTDHRITPITPVAHNSTASYFIAPDGSKQGWDVSVAGKLARDEFVDYIKHLEPYPPDWALIQYGDEGGNDYMIDSNHISNNEEVYLD